VIHLVTREIILRDNSLFVFTVTCLRELYVIKDLKFIFIFVGSCKFPLVWLFLWYLKFILQLNCEVGYNLKIYLLFNRF
jgi:hypothetical protein